MEHARKEDVQLIEIGDGIGAAAAGTNGIGIVLKKSERNGTERNGMEWVQLEWQSNIVRPTETQLQKHAKE